MIPLSWYLVFSAAMFCVGLFGVLSRKNMIGILLGVELMLNAVNVNILAFWRYLYAPTMSGMVFVAIVFTAAAAETAVALALIISVYRRRKTIVADEVNLLKG
jgi:NADH:ubiquinone oxidoreductase subunit K